MNTLSSLFFDNIFAQPAISGKKVSTGLCESVMYTSKGIVRNVNEDRSALLDVVVGGKRIMAAVISDGMGGLSSGDEVSSCAAACFLSYIVVHTKGVVLIETVRDAVLYSNYRVKSRFGGHGGATLAAVVQSNEAAIFAHVGDSRVYSLGESLALKTNDDTPTYVARQHQKGDGIDFGASDNRLLQYIGCDYDIDVHIGKFNVDQMRSNKAFVLTTDGAHYIGSYLINKIHENSDCDTTFAKRVVNTSEWTGNGDNSSIIIFCPEHSNVTDSASKELDVTVHTTNVALKVLCGFTSELIKEEMRLISEFKSDIVYKRLSKQSRKQSVSRKNSKKSKSHQGNANRLVPDVSIEVSND